MGHPNKSKLSIPKTLKERLLNEKVVLFVGAGLSRNAKAPDWKSLLKKLILFCEEEAIQLNQDEKEELLNLIQGGASQLLIAAEHLKIILQEKMNEFIENNTKLLKPIETHLLIAKLALHGIITTNYDLLIEEGIRSYTGLTPEVILYSSTHKLARLDEYNSWIFKIHGSCSEPGTIILSSSDYERLPPVSIKTLSQIFQEYTVLFIGYSLSDPDILDLLSKIRETFKGLNRRHYALLPFSEVGPVMEKYLLDTYKIQIIKYQPSDSTHPEVNAFLNQLIDLKNASKYKSMEKLVLLITASRIDNGSDEPVILVTDSNPQWKATIQKEGSGNIEQAAYLLPSLTSITRDDINHKEVIANFLGVNEGELTINIDSSPFYTTKFNPSIGDNTNYTFTFAHIIFHHNIFKSRDTIELKGRRYIWYTLMGLRGHPATQKLNGDVIIEICKRYGSNLETLPRSLHEPIKKNSDPYTIRSIAYGSLPWIQDTDIYERMFRDINNGKVEGILELGCGPANLGLFVVDKKGLPYVGIDQSEDMIREAEKTLRGKQNVNVYQMNITHDESVLRYNQWVFVLKNILHLVDDKYSMLSTLFDRFGVPDSVVIAETVSPNLASLSWVQMLFEELGMNYKYQWFVRGQLEHVFRYAGYSIMRQEELEQFIDINRWLDSFQTDEKRKDEVLRFIESAPKNIINDMKIHKDPNGCLKMLRLQSIYRIK